VWSRRACERRAVAASFWITATRRARIRCHHTPAPRRPACLPSALPAPSEGNRGRPHACALHIRTVLSLPINGDEIRRLSRRHSVVLNPQLIEVIDTVAMAILLVTFFLPPTHRTTANLHTVTHASSARQKIEYCYGPLDDTRHSPQKGCREYCRRGIATELRSREEAEELITASRHDAP